MKLVVYYIAAVFFLSTAAVGVRAEVSVRIDLHRNAPGTTSNSIVVVDNSPSDTYVYFVATASSGDVSDIYNAQLVISRDSNPEEDFVTPVIYPLGSSSAGAEALVVAAFNGIIDYGTWNVVDANVGVVLFSAELQAQTDIILLSCLNDDVHLKVPSTYNNHYMSLDGAESNTACSYQLGNMANVGNSVRINMTSCGLAYNVPFQMSFRAQENFNVDEDVVILMRCRGMDTTLEVSNRNINSDLNTVVAQDHLSTVQAMMYLHLQGDEQAVVYDTVQVKTPVSLKIEMDPLFNQDFDILPLECYVNDYKVVDYGCASYPMNNFTKTAVGNFRSDFKMFRVVTNGLPNSDLTFRCILYVCHYGQCPQVPCITNN